MTPTGMPITLTLRSPPPTTKAAHPYTSSSGRSTPTHPRPYSLQSPVSISPTSVTAAVRQQHHHLRVNPTSSTTIASSAKATSSTMTGLTAVSYMPSTQPTPSRKRKIIVDPPTATAAAGNKRHRTWTEIEYEEMLEEATLLREELELLVAVAGDLCRDLSCDPSHVRKFTATLKDIDDKMNSTDDLTERQVREMCHQMITMMQYLCQRHYAHFALVDMQDHLRDSRDRFMRFICQYATMIGLYR